jgi:hypothetical protein
MRLREIATGVLVAVGLAVSAAAVAPSPAEGEEIILTTYYPSPRGVYRELRTTHNALLARLGGASPSVRT